MLCRALLTAIAISCTFSCETITQATQSTQRALKDLICVLVLSGMQREDLDVNLLKKLEHYNLNYDAINNIATRKDCITQTTRIIRETDISPNQTLTEAPTATNILSTANNNSAGNGFVAAIVVQDETSAIISNPATESSNSRFVTHYTEHIPETTTENKSTQNTAKKIEILHSPLSRFLKEQSDLDEPSYDTSIEKQWKTINKKNNNITVVMKKSLSLLSPTRLITQTSTTYDNIEQDKSRLDISKFKPEDISKILLQYINSQPFEPTSPSSRVAVNSSPNILSNLLNINPENETSNLNNSTITSIFSRSLPGLNTQLLTLGRELLKADYKSPILKRQWKYEDPTEIPYKYEHENNSRYIQGMKFNKKIEVPVMDRQWSNLEVAKVSSYKGVNNPDRIHVPNMDKDGEISRADNKPVTLNTQWENADYTKSLPNNYDHNNDQVLRILADRLRAGELISQLNMPRSDVGQPQQTDSNYGQRIFQKPMNLYNEKDISNTKEIPFGLRPCSNSSYVGNEHNIHKNEEFSKAFDNSRADTPAVYKQGDNVKEDQRLKMPLNYEREHISNKQDSETSNVRETQELKKITLNYQRQTEALRGILASLLSDTQLANLKEIPKQTYVNYEHNNNPSYVEASKLDKHLEILGDNDKNVQQPIKTAYNFGRDTSLSNKKNIPPYNGREISNDWSLTKIHDAEPVYEKKHNNPDTINLDKESDILRSIPNPILNMLWMNVKNNHEHSNFPSNTQTRNLDTSERKEIPTANYRQWANLEQPYKSSETSNFKKLPTDEELKQISFDYERQIHPENIRTINLNDNIERLRENPILQTQYNKENNRDPSYIQAINLQRPKQALTANIRQWANLGQPNEMPYDIGQDNNSDKKEVTFNNARGTSNGKLIANDQEPKQASFNFDRQNNPSNRQWENLKQTTKLPYNFKSNNYDNRAVINTYKSSEILSAGKLPNIEELKQISLRYEEQLNSGNIQPSDIRDTQTSIQNQKQTHFNYENNNKPSYAQSLNFDTRKEILPTSNLQREYLRQPNVMPYKFGLNLNSDDKETSRSELLANVQGSNKLSFPYNTQTRNLNKEREGLLNPYNTGVINMDKQRETLRGSPSLMDMQRLNIKGNPNQKYFNFDYRNNPSYTQISSFDGSRQKEQMTASNIKSEINQKLIPYYFESRNTGDKGVDTSYKSSETSNVRNLPNIQDLKRLRSSFDYEQQNKPGNIRTLNYDKNQEFMIRDYASPIFQTQKQNNLSKQTQLAHIYNNSPNFNKDRKMLESESRQLENLRETKEISRYLEDDGDSGNIRATILDTIAVDKEQVPYNYRHDKSINLQNIHREQKSDNVEDIKNKPFERQSVKSVEGHQRALSDNANYSSWLLVDLTKENNRKIHPKTYVEQKFMTQLNKQDTNNDVLISRQPTNDNSKPTLTEDKLDTGNYTHSTDKSKNLSPETIKQIAEAVKDMVFKNIEKPLPAATTRLLSTKPTCTTTMVYETSTQSAPTTSISSQRPLTENREQGNLLATNTLKKIRYLLNELEKSAQGKDSRLSDKINYHISNKTNGENNNPTSKHTVNRFNQPDLIKLPTTLVHTVNPMVNMFQKTENIENVDNIESGINIQRNPVFTQINHEKGTHNTPQRIIYSQSISPIMTFEPGNPGMNNAMPLVINTYALQKYGAVLPQTLPNGQPQTISVLTPVKQNSAAKKFQQPVLPLHREIPPLHISLPLPITTRNISIFATKPLLMDMTRNDRQHITNDNINNKKYNDLLRRTKAMSIYASNPYNIANSSPEQKYNLQLEQPEQGISYIRGFHEKLENNYSSVREPYEQYENDNTESQDYYPKLEVNSRLQQPIPNAKKINFDDTPFKNFLKSQQKVNEMLELLLAHRARDKTIETA